MAASGEVCHVEHVREGRGHLHVLQHLVSASYTNQIQYGVFQNLHSQDLHLSFWFCHEQRQTQTQRQRQTQTQKTHISPARRRKDKQPSSFRGTLLQQD